MEKEILMQLKDTYIEEIESDTDSYSGCETCDYGSSYVNEFTIIMENGRIEIKVDNMYYFGISESFLMKTFLQNAASISNMTESEFIAWLEQTFDEDQLEVESVTFDVIGFNDKYKGELIF